MAYQHENPSKKPSKIQSTHIPKVEIDLKLIPNRTDQSVCSKSLGFPESMSAYHDLNLMDQHGKDEKNDHKLSDLQFELCVPAQSKYAQPITPFIDGFLIKKAMDELTCTVGNPTQNMESCLFSTPQTSNVILDDSSNIIEKNPLYNVKKLEDLLLKIFKGAPFSIDEFKLTIPELHILVEILIRKTKNASKNRYFNKNW